MLRRLGVLNQNQVSGMDVFTNLCNLAESTNIPVYFLGSTDNILDKIKLKLDEEYPILKIAGMKAIPYLSVDDIYSYRDTELIEEINQSQAGIVFVCLGCPEARNLDVSTSGLDRRSDDWSRCGFFNVCWN